MMRHKGLAGAALGTMLLVAACAPSESESASSAGTESAAPTAGGELTVARINPFEGFELDNQSLNSSYQLSQAVLEQLVKPSTDGTSLAPGIASSWEYSDDNMTLTVHIDPAATFSNGEDVTSADVAFSIDVWKAGPNYGLIYEVIDSTTIVDDKTIELNLAYPSTVVPAYLAWANAGIVPADFGGVAEADFWQTPIGAGAFAVESWSSSGDVVLVRNEHYHVDGQPYVDRVVSSFASDQNSVSLQLQSGQLHLADEILPITAGTLPEENVIVSAPHLTPVLLINTTVEGLDDATVRQALGYAIDYEAIVATAYMGYAEAPVGALPTNSDHWAAPSEDYFTHDVEKAKELLAGVDLPTITLLTATDPTWSLTAQIVQENLAEVGITVEIETQDTGTTFASTAAGDYDIAMYSYNAISPDVSDPAQYVASTDMMFTQLATDDLWGILEAYEVAADSDKEPIVTEIQDYLFDEAPFIALAHGSTIQGTSGDAQGVNLMPWPTYDLATVSLP